MVEISADPIALEELDTQGKIDFQKAIGLGGRPAYLDLADLGVVYGDGSDSTQAISDAIARIRAGTSAFGVNQQYIGIQISGPIRTGNVPELSDGGGTAGDGSNNAANGLTIKLSSKWELDETLVVKHARIIGEPWFAGQSFAKSGAAVLMPSSSMPNGTTVLKALGQASVYLENLDILYRRGVGIESWGSNRTWKNVNIGLPVSTEEVAGYPGLVLGNGFWIDLDNVNVQRYAKETVVPSSLHGYPSGAVVVIGSDSTKPDFDYTGIMEWRNSVLAGGSVVIGSADNYVTTVTLKNVVTEYPGVGGENFVITRGQVKQLTVDKCGAADAHVSVSLIHNTGEIYGCEIKGYPDVVTGNPFNADWALNSSELLYGMRLEGSGVVNGMAFGRHEDDGVRALPALQYPSWELALQTLPSSGSGPSIGKSAGFQVAVNGSVQLGYVGVSLQTNDAIVVKTLARVGANQNVTGGEVILGFTNSTISDGRGGSTSFTVNGYRAWPISTGGDARLGGHWREIIVVAIVKTVGSSPTIECNCRGITYATRFLNPCWWKIPASEYDGLEHLRQLVSKLAKAT